MKQIPKPTAPRFDTSESAAGEEGSPDKPISEVIFDKALSMLTTSERLGADGGQHAMAGADLMATAVKANQPSPRDVIELGERIAKAVIGIREAHQPHIDPPPVPPEIAKYEELQNKVMSGKATEEERAEFKTILDAEVEKGCAHRKVFFARRAFEATRNRIIEDIAQRATERHFGGGSKDEFVTKLQAEIEEAFHAIDALEQSLPHPAFVL